MDTEYDTPNRPRQNRPLGFWSVVAIIFFEVSGGPFGIEDSVRFGGPRLALLGLLLLPIIWSLPEALVTAEMGTMFPENSGFVAWVTAAFGPFWGFHRGILSWIRGVIDNSIYPLFLARYLKWFFPILKQTIPLKLFLIVITVAMTYMNYRGLKLVGRTTVFLTVFILSPFVAMCFVGYDQVDASKWFESNLQNNEIDLYPFINVMFWNLNYWDAVATLSGEIGQAAHILPRALLTAVVVVVAGYFVPVLLGIGIMGEDNWPEGFFAYLGNKVGGVWFEGWVTLAAVASQMGLFTAELSSDAYLLLGLAETGVLPKFLMHKSKHGTPTLALLLSCSGAIVMIISFDFVSAVEMLNNSYCIGVLTEFVAFIYLRYSAPDFPRPFKVPLDINGLIFMLAPGTLLILVILFAPFYYKKWSIVIYTGVTWLISLTLYYFLKYLRKHDLVKFNQMEMITITPSHDCEMDNLVDKRVHDLDNY